MKKLKKLASALLLATLVCSSVIPALASGASAPVKTKLIIHKLKYSDDNIDKITNDGLEKTNHDSKITTYDAAKYGKVGFTLYKIDDGKLKTLVGTSNNTQEVANTIAGKIDTEAGLATKVGEEVFQTGTEPATITVETETNGHYLLVETTSPSVTVVEKAQPMLLDLPVKNTDKNGFLSDVHLYPKNKVDDSKRSANFQKVTLDLVAGTSANYKGAKFELLYSKEKPTDDTKYANVMKDGNKVVVESKEDGKFTVDDLQEGYYALKEINTNEVQVIGQSEVTGAKYFGYGDLIKFSFDGVKGIEVGTLNANTNTLKTNNKFTYTKDLMQIPNINAQVTTKTANGTSAGFGDTVDFTIEVKNPLSGTNGVMTVTDTPSKGLKVDKDSVEVKAYDVKNTETSFGKLDDSVTHVNLRNGLKYKASVDEQGKLIVKFPAVTGSLPEAINTPTKFVVTYKATVTKDADLTQPLVNTAKTSYNDPMSDYTPNTPDTPGTPDNPTNQVKLDAYDQVFKKVDDGLWGTSMVKKGLNGAEFIVSKVVGNKTLYRIEDTNNKYGWSEDKEQAYKYTSGEDGTFTVDGLTSKTPEGVEIKYTATEVKAPADYNLPQKEEDRKHEFTVGTDTVDANEDGNKVITIQNQRSVDAPMTGYEKSTIAIGLMAFGLVIVAAASKKKKETAR